MNNPELAAQVADRLMFDPALPTHAIGFSADGTEVRVHGCVPSIEDRQAVVQAVARVPGVEAVDDELVIDPTGDGAGSR